jgi:hypothetical protein
MKRANLTHSAMILCTIQFSAAPTLASVSDFFMPILTWPPVEAALT